MRLRRIEIRNFRSHSNSVIQFNSGINLIIGQNGAGKSSILEAVFAALYLGHPSFPKGYRQVNTRMGSTGMELRLEFEHDGRVCSILRKEGESHLKIDGKVTAEGESEIARWVEKNVFSLHVYRNALYIRQGEIERIITDEETRNKLLRKVLGIEDLEKAEENLKETLREIKRRKTEKKNLILREREIKESIAEYERKMEETMKEISMLREELNISKKELSEVKEKHALMKERKEKLSNLEKKIAENERKYEGLLELTTTYRRQIEELTRELKELKEMHYRLKELEGVAEEYENLKELLKKEEILNRLILKKERLKERRGHLQTEMEKEEELRKELDRLEEEYRRLNKRLKELKKSTEDLRKAEMLIQEKERYLGELRKANMTREELLKKLDEIGKAKKELEELMEDIMKIKNALSELEGREKSLQENLKRLEGANVCPLCRRPIEEHDEEEIMREYSVEFERIAGEKRRLLERLMKLEERKKTLEEILKDEKRLISLSKVLSLLDSTEEKLREFDLERLRKEAEEFEETSRKVVEIKRDILNLQRELEKIKKVREELEEIENSLKALSDNIDSVKSEIVNRGFSSMGEVKKRMSDLEVQYKEYLSLKSVPEKIETTERKISKLKAIRDEKEKTLMEIKQELAELRDKWSILSKQFSEEEFNEVERRYRHLLEQVAGLEKTVEGQKNLLEELKKHLDELRKRMKEILEAKGELEILEKLEKELTGLKDKVAKFKAEEEIRGLSEVERIAGETFSEMTEGKYQGIRIIREKKFKKERLLIKVLYQGREVDVDFLSGGERIALGLAFRLALSLYKVGNMELLILDEPTPFLDEERRRKLIEIISQHLRKIPQVIIVSHDEELKDAADYVIRVTQLAGRSRVEVENVGAYQ